MTDPQLTEDQKNELVRLSELLEGLEHLVHKARIRRNEILGLDRPSPLPQLLEHVRDLLHDHAHWGESLEQDLVDAPRRIYNRANKSLSLLDGKPVENAW